MSFVYLTSQDADASDSPRYTQRSTESTLFRNDSSSSSSSSSTSSSSFSSTTTSTTGTTSSVAQSDAAKKRIAVMEVYCKQEDTREQHGNLYFQTPAEYGTYLEEAEEIIQALISVGKVDATTGAPIMTQGDIKRAKEKLERERKKITSEHKELMQQMKEERRSENETLKRKALVDPTWGVALDDELDAEQQKNYVVDMKRARMYREVDDIKHRDQVNRKKPLTAIEVERMMGYDRDLFQKKSKSELNDSMSCFLVTEQIVNGATKTKSLDGSALFVLK